MEIGELTINQAKELEAQLAEAQKDTERLSVVLDDSKAPEDGTPSVIISIDPNTGDVIVKPGE